MDKIFSNIKQRIVFYLDNQGISKEDFYKKTGISASNFKGLGAKSELGGDKIAKILTIYPKINPEWLISGNEPMLKVADHGQKTQKLAEEEKPSRYKSVPLIPVKAMAGYSNGDVQVNDYDVLENYVIPEFTNKGVRYLIRASGSSMYPKYSNGDLLACRPVTDVSFFQWGKVYVLDTDQGALVKRLFKCKDNDACIECHSDNKEHYPPFILPKTSIRKISIVVGVIRLE